ncbi:MAG: hypothetical protein RLZZ450_3891 [Pseudomonadota bacterium]|jgi:hypothetical protein
MFVQTRVSAAQVAIVFSLTCWAAACGDAPQPRDEPTSPGEVGDAGVTRAADRDAASPGTDDDASRPGRGQPDAGGVPPRNVDAGRDGRDAASGSPPDAQSAGSDASAGATRDDILVPAQGALLGMFFGADRLAATETKLGRKVPVHLTYVAWNDDWPNQVAQPDIAANRTPLINLEPSDAKLADLIDGKYDAMLTKHAKNVQGLQKKLFLDFAAEMNGNWSTWDGSHNGKSSAVYIAAYRHLHDVMVAGGATNIVWVWCPNVESEPQAAWNEALAYYPGDAYVDWTCVDGYNWGTTNGSGWQSFERVFSAIYAELATKGKPIMIGEMASTEEGGDKAAFIAGIVPALHKFPLIKSLVWFDIDKETDWRISSSPGSEAAFVKMASDPYFNP